MKIQIWLQPHELDLTIDCLRFMKEQLNDIYASDAYKMAGRYTHRRILEVIEIMEAARTRSPAASTPSEPTQ